MKPAICRHNRKRNSVIVILSVAAAMMIEAAGCRSIPQPSGSIADLDLPEDESAIVARVNGEPLTYDALVDDMEGGIDFPLEPEAVQNSVSLFPTFKETAHALCTDDRGRPLILLFSASSCSHCRWVGGIFDLVARKYADEGLVTALHFDIETGDDLLTEAVETQIPESYLSIGKEGDPDGLMPYFNFGCMYDRIGTGYEEQDDLAAEAKEMCRVIETLLH